MDARVTSKERSVDVQEFIDMERLSPYQWMIFALCLLIMITDGFDTAIIGFVAPVLSKEWGVSVQSLAPVITSSVLGLAIGALIAGPCADRWGRKPVLLISVVIFGGFTYACAYADSMTSLLMLRVLAGLGLGAATPNATTLLSEYLPSRLRSTMVNAMFCGFTLGAALGGFIAAGIIPHYGWRSVFILGGAAPLVLVVVGMLILPESIRYMVARGAAPKKISAILARISGRANIDATAFRLPEQPVKTKSGSPIALILSRQFRVGTIALWTAYFMAMVVFYVITSWMPTLIREAHVTGKEASLISALFPLGGTLGAIMCGWLMDRLNAHVVLAIAYVASGALIALLGQTFSHADYFPIIVFVTGFFTGAALVSMPALASGFYPTSGRASGVAWMLGIGRFGGVGGAMLGGALIQFGLGTPTILSLLSIPAVIAAVSIIVKNMDGKLANKGNQG